jgi:hypothetical protein
LRVSEWCRRADDGDGEEEEEVVGMGSDAVGGGIESAVRAEVS